MISIPDLNLRLALVAALGKARLIPRPDLNELRRRYPPVVEWPDEDANAVYNRNLAERLGATPLPVDALRRLRTLVWRDQEMLNAIWPQFDGWSDQFDIKDLTGIDHCRALETLDLGTIESEGTDLVVLGSLTRLRELSLSHHLSLGPHWNPFLQRHPPLDVTFLSSLVELRELSFSAQIDDLGPLASLTKLQSLSLQSIQAKDLSPLTTLRSLKKLNITWTGGETGPSAAHAQSIANTLAAHAVDVRISWPCGVIDAQAPVITPARHHGLEERILESPDDEQRYLDYASWLEEHGDPFAALIGYDIQLAHEKSAKVVEKRRRHFLRYESYFLGGFKNDSAYSWRFGFVRGLHCSPKVGELARMLAAPAMRFLTRLELQTQEGTEALQGLLDGNPAPSLRVLELYQYQKPVDASRLWKRLPLLRHVTLNGRDITLGEMDLPEARFVHIGGLGSNTGVVESVMTARWPKLEELSLEQCIVGDIEKILDGAHLSQLRSLRLGAYELDKLFVVLAKSKVLSQLDELDLRRSYPLTSKDVALLLSLRRHFAHLSVFDMDTSKLSASEKKSLGGLRKKAL